MCDIYIVVIIIIEVNNKLISICFLRELDAKMATLYT